MHNVLGGFMSHEVRDIVKRKIREQYARDIVKLCSEITLSEQVQNLFEFAKTDLFKLRNEVESFKKTKLYNKIQKFDQSLKLKPVFKAKSKSYKKNLLDFDTRINPKSLFFLILAMDRNTEDSIFENPDDFVIYLMEAGETNLANYVARNWLYSTMDTVLWDVFDEED